MGDRPGMIGCYYLMGDLALTHRDPDRAAESYEQARRGGSGAWPGRAGPAHLRLADVRLFRGDAAGATAGFQPRRAHRP